MWLCVCTGNILFTYLPRTVNFIVLQFQYFLRIQIKKSKVTQVQLTKNKVDRRNDDEENETDSKTSHTEMNCVKKSQKKRIA